MSRLDSHDYSYTSSQSMGYTRVALDREGTGLVYGSPFSSVPGNQMHADRRIPVSSGAFQPRMHSVSPASSTPRSMSNGMHVKEYKTGMLDGSSVPNRHTPNLSSTQLQHLLPNHHRPSPSLPPSAGPTHGHVVTHSSPSFYGANATDPERDTYLYRQGIHSSTSNHSPNNNNNNNHINLLRSTLWWGDLEPWMDEEYAKQVCTLMNWDPVNIKVPAGSDANGQHANNPGYCFLTFSSPSVAASVLNQVNSDGAPQSPTMPNSTKPFTMNWATTMPGACVPSLHSAAGVPLIAQPQQYQKEYSIFVGDLAPETSNSDLVAVFRNPVLGLRNDREPKFIRPFLSCKSAKIMLDPVTGVSRGYGFVRFTDETDQQRALVEMHGLYCLSRPMRISPATAKYKPPQVQMNLPQIQLPSSSSMDQSSNSVTVAIPVGGNGQAHDISAPIPVSAPNTSPGSNGSFGNSGSASEIHASGSVPSLGSGSSNSVSSTMTAVSEDMMNLSPEKLVQLAHQYANSGAGEKGPNGMVSSITAPLAHDAQEGSPRYMISEESWKHHAQARAILSNLIGPNGEQLTSTDPYNTTVFVGGLSPLISEETLRTFFAPFGDIHYVKVPIGKHCGFVQFVRKADAERAIEKMQGFPIGGSRIRLSWGRSQYKAAQAAAQAAQAAALQAQFQAQMASAPVNQMSSEQVAQMLHKLGITEANGHENAATNPSNFHENPKLSFDMYSKTLESRGPSDHMAHRPQSSSTFSPFSPDPNQYFPEVRGTDGYQARLFGSSFDESHIEARRPAPLSRNHSAQRFGSFLDSNSAPFEPSRSSSRQEPISRPNSGPSFSQGRASRYGGSQGDHEHIHDMNGTLASLELDHAWKSSAFNNMESHA
ncbi:RNA-binding domain-containing protein [Coniophora puteana RWD-64-598 SS2]|uniref:RNA-binding domain-containing protein n=1 Tax=Coniophora puteana (strain RWD-64-598) TaxID=741705 RepID=A0A5M3MB33_CONPW|nr:RNA-binding domain-containing protein [Coniophora puteana RWD-64-598 SS2]EIW76206.1 RNA-binding domain-containing protein [Coniophora puteana RWD-64-598 SS2]